MGSMIGMEQIKIQIKRLKKNGAIHVPRYMTEGSSGMDLFACLETDVTLEPGKGGLFPLGFR